jgi:hypothetical protein
MNRTKQIADEIGKWAEAVESGVSDVQIIMDNLRITIPLDDPHIRNTIAIRLRVVACEIEFETWNLPAAA